MKANPELMGILEKKDFANIERKQADALAPNMSKSVTNTHLGIDAGDHDDLDASDREQKEEMAQQNNERNKLKHDALNRYEKKLKLKAKKPKSAMGPRRKSFF